MDVCLVAGRAALLKAVEQGVHLWVRLLSAAAFEGEAVLAQLSLCCK